MRRAQPGQWLRSNDSAVRHLIAGTERPGAMFLTACGLDVPAEGLHYEEPDRPTCRNCGRSGGAS